MSIGRWVRNFSGPFERPICALYRRIFIDVERCTQQIEKSIPHGTHVIDVGGGDGSVLNYLLKRRPDLRVSMLDLRDSIGLFLDPKVRQQVDFYPSTSLRDFSQRESIRAAALLVSDVIHHVPKALRADFIRDCDDLLLPHGLLIIKDVEPIGFIAWLSKMADRYITGDRHVTLISSADMTALVHEHTNLRKVSSLFSARELPNYALLFSK